jgi:hypothetical protein
VVPFADAQRDVEAPDSSPTHRTLDSEFAPIRIEAHLSCLSQSFDALRAGRHVLGDAIVYAGEVDNGFEPSRGARSNFLCSALNKR